MDDVCVLQDNAGLTRIMDYILGSGGLTLTIRIIYILATVVVNVMYVLTHLNKMADTFADESFIFGLKFHCSLGFNWH